MNCSQCDSIQFRKACSRFPTGVTVTTLLDKEGDPHGITVSSFTSVSLSPPLVLVCIDHRSPFLAHLAVDCCFGVNVLGEHQQDLSRRFSRTWEERFRGIEWYAGNTGVPLLFDVSAVFECSVREIMPGGDHMIVIGHVLYVTSSGHSPLTYHNSCYSRIAGASAT